MSWMSVQLDITNTHNFATQHQLSIVDYGNTVQGIELATHTQTSSYSDSDVSQTTQRVFLDKVGGTGGSDYVDMIWGERVPTGIGIKAPTRSGFYFKGYWTGFLTPEWNYWESGDGRMGLEIYNQNMGVGYFNLSPSMDEFEGVWLFDPVVDKDGNEVQTVLYAMWASIDGSAPKVEKPSFYSSFFSSPAFMYISFALAIGFVGVCVTSITIMLKRRKNASIVDYSNGDYYSNYDYYGNNHSNYNNYNNYNSFNNNKNSKNSNDWW